MAVASMPPAHPFTDVRDCGRQLLMLLYSRAPGRCHRTGIGTVVVVNAPDGQDVNRAAKEDFPAGRAGTKPAIAALPIHDTARTPAELPFVRLHIRESQKVEDPSQELLDAVRARHPTAHLPNDLVNLSRRMVADDITQAMQDRAVATI